MAGTFTFLGLHFIFSAKNRIAMIDDVIRERLHEYVGGIIREINGRPLAINSMPEHLHLYAHLPKTISVSKFMETIKGSSSKWIHQTFPGRQEFHWQEGYGAFTVSKSNERQVIEYIRCQQEHHCRKSFQDEFLDFLRVNGIEYDEKYIWN